VGVLVISSTLVICEVQLLFVLFYVLFVCKCVLPPDDNPTAVNKYIRSKINPFFSSTSSAYLLLCTGCLFHVITHIHIHGR